MLKHWLGFLVLVCLLGTGTASMFNMPLAARIFAGWFFLLFAVFFLRGWFRLLHRIGKAEK